MRLVPVTLAGVALSTASPALAARATVRDTRGDAKAPWDIVRIKVSNGQRALRLRVVYRGALQTRNAFLANVGIDLGAPSESIYSPDYTADLLTGSSDPEAPDRRHLYRGSQRIRCRGFTVKVHRRRGLLSITVPQRCFEHAGRRARITAYAYQVRGAADEADYIDRYSQWIARG